MTDEVNPPRRAYHSPLRADQAQQTRRRILESARRLFVARGYARTTVAAVAEDAGVSPETIYLSLGSKRGLLEGVMDISGSARLRRRRRLVVARGRRPAPARPSAWRRWWSTAAASWPAPAPSTPSSAAQPTTKPFAAALGRQLLNGAPGQPDRAHRPLPRRGPQTGPVRHRGGRALLRPRQPRPLPPAHRRARVGPRAPPELVVSAAAARAARPGLSTSRRSGRESLPPARCRRRRATAAAGGCGGRTPAPAGGRRHPRRPRPRCG